MNLVTHQQGFTLIELIIVFSIMMILSTIGIASFVTYSHSESVNTTIQDIKTVLFTARSRAGSQLKQGTCASSNLQLQGYEVLFCCTTSGCPTCYQPTQQTGYVGQGDYQPNPDYEMNIVCSNPDGSGVTHEVVLSKKFPPNISFVSGSPTTATSFFFQSVTGAVATNNSSANPSEVAISGYGITKTATVSASGVVQ